MDIVDYDNKQNGEIQKAHLKMRVDKTT